MKIMTKEWVKDFELHELIVALEPNSDKKIPFVFTNGGTDCVAKEDLYTVKTNFNLTDRENELSFVMLPDTFETDLDFLGDGTEINEKTYKNDFLFQYLNRLRVISYLPDGILKLVKDKRLLALGYAEKEVKKEILKFAKPVFDKAMTICEKQSEASIQAEKGLTIHEQFKTRPYSSSLPYLFDGVEITKVEKVDGDIYLTLDEYDTVVFSGAKIIEEETDILNSCVIDIELYKKENCHELHFLLRKINDNLIENYYYATYEFKDMKFKD